MKTYNCLLVVLLMVLVCSASASASWSQYRGDAQHSGVSTTPLDIDVPGTRWSLPVGGTAVGVFTLDINGDDAPDLLSLEGGKVVARSMNGDVYWDSPPILARKIVAVEDVNGDGDKEVVIDVVSGVVLVAAKTGKVLWQSSATLVVENICTCLVEDVVGEAAPEILIADCAMNGGKPHLKGTVHLFSFDAGFDSDLPLISTEEESRDYEAGAGIGLADIDGDGVREIIASGWHHFYAYDPATGALKWTSEDLTPTMGDENFARCDYESVDLDGDGAEELFVFTDAVFIDTPSRRLFLLDWDESQNWSVSWTDSVPNPELDSHAWPLHPVADVDGDGVVEVVASHWSSETGWTTRIYDPETGDVTQTLTGELSLDLVDPYETGQALLLSVTSDLRKPGTYAMKKVIALGGEEPEEIFALASRLWIGPFEGVFSPESQGELVALWDSDADDWADQVGVFSLPDGALVASTPTTDIATLASVGTLFGEGGVIVFNASGEVTVFDRWLSLRNDSDNDGHGDLTYGGYAIDRVAVWEPEGGSPLLAMHAAGGRIRVVDGATGNPFTQPDLILEDGSNLEQSPVFLSLAGEPAVLVLGLDLDRQLTAKAIRMDGTAAWSVVVGGLGGVFKVDGEPLITDANGDGTDDLVLAVRDSSDSTVRRVFCIDGANGQHMWPGLELPAAGGGVGLLSASQDGLTIHIVANKTIFGINGATGEITTEQLNPANHWYGVVRFVDLDGEEGMEMVLTGTSKGACALSSTFEVLWKHEPGPSLRAPATFVDNGTELMLYAARYNSPMIDVVRASDGTVQQSIALIMSSVWADPEHLPEDYGNVTDIITVPDIVGNGKPGVLVTSTDGYLYAIDVDGEKRWSHYMGGILGAPAVFDADDDGTGEVAVPVGTGHLAVVERSVLPGPDFVCENDGSGPAAGPESDVDEKEGGSSLHVNWAAVEGATGYTVRLLSAFGTLIAEIPNVEDGTGVELTDLALQIGHTYYTRVRPLKVDDGHAVSGGLAISDGVTLVDLGPPEIVAFEADPSFFAPAGEPSQTLITAEMTDSNGLAMYRLELHSEDDQIVGLWEGDLSGTSATEEWSWDGSDGLDGWVPSGNYTVSLWIQDVAGKSDQSMIEVYVCSPPLIYDETKDACVEFIEPEVVDEDPKEDVQSEDVEETDDSVEPDAGTDVSTTESGSDSGCSCDQAGGEAPWSRALWWWSAFVLIGIGRWRLSHRRGDAPKGS